MEVVVSMLIVAVMVSSVMSVALTGRQSGGKADRKMIAGEEARRLSLLLSDYITADATAAPASVMNIPPYGGTAWRWPTPIVDSCGACWALATGSHTLTNFLPAWLQGPPYNGTITYFVTAPGGTGVRLVNVTVDWDDP